MEFVLICYGCKPTVFEAETRAEATAKAAEIAKAAGMSSYLCYNRNAELIADSDRAGKRGTQ
jgi:hypothetical protein